MLATYWNIFDIILFDGDCSIVWWLDQSGYITAYNWLFITSSRTALSDILVRGSHPYILLPAIPEHAS